MKRFLSILIIMSIHMSLGLAPKMSEMENLQAYINKYKELQLQTQKNAQVTTMNISSDMDSPHVYYNGRLKREVDNFLSWLLNEISEAKYLNEVEKTTLKNQLNQ